MGIAVRGEGINDHYKYRGVAEGMQLSMGGKKNADPQGGCREVSDHCY